jgi:hypothetical protein
MYFASQSMCQPGGGFLLEITLKTVNLAVSKPYSDYTQRFFTVRIIA